VAIHNHDGDLPANVQFTGSVAIDTETMGLNPFRDALCVVQLSDGKGDAHVIRLKRPDYDCPNLKALVSNPRILKIFHFARFDLGMIQQWLGAPCFPVYCTKHLVRFGPGSAYDAPVLKAVLADPARLKLYHFARFDLASIQAFLKVVAAPVYCTKTASRLIRTYTDRHGLKDLSRELLNLDMSKAQQSSDWGSDKLSEAQLSYAASDVLHLHELKARLDVMLAREGRTELAQACFDFLPVRAALDLSGWAEQDIFAHS